MRELTPAEIAVLSLVVEAPRHGYQIDRLIDERGMRAWTEIGFSSIYFLLGRLERAGLVVASETEGKRGRSRRVFAATDGGRQALAVAVRRLIAVPDRPWPLLLGLANAPALTRAELVVAVTERIAALDDSAAEIEQAASRAPDEWFVTELFDHARTMTRAEVRWLADFRERLEKGTTMTAASNTPPPPRKPGVPRLVERPSLTMAVVHSVGDPNDVGPQVFPRLYGSLYPLKFQLKKQGIEYKIAPPRARWGLGPDDFNLPRDQWQAWWAIPIPAGTAELTNKPGVTPPEIETWEYGTVAEILHVGPYSEEWPTIDTLHRFIEQQGYRIVGRHEEEYLTSAAAATQKTVIRYQVAPRD